MDCQIDAKNAPILLQSPSDQSVVRVFPDEWMNPIRVSEIPQLAAKRDVELEYRIIRVLTENERMNTRLYTDAAAKIKNRYRDMIPYTDNRVKLTDGGYINASYMINGLGTNRKAFIASQGPLKTTITDQWDMIWNEGIFSILTIGKLAEGTTEKIALYWPEHVGDVLKPEGGNWSIECSSECEVSSGLWKRELTLTNISSCSKRQICHFHFVAWPDHGSVPPATMEVLASLVKYERSTHPDSPMLVHCSAGVGRTGTVLAMANCVEIVESQLKQNGGNLSECWLSVMTTVLNLRECRVHIVERTWQYQSIYEAIEDLVKQHKNGNTEMIPLRSW